eukprot:10490126-Prorocentrum_lima.AAC.1
MTSSLVGSEMCIRDSSHSQHRIAHRQQQANETSLNEKRRQVAPIAALNLCLLYTSDAADDM